MADLRLIQAVSIIFILTQVCSGANVITINTCLNANVTVETRSGQVKVVTDCEDTNESIQVCSGVNATVETRSCPLHHQDKEAEDTIQVHIYSLEYITKLPAVYNVRSSDKIYSLKYKISERENIKPWGQCLSTNGRDQLDDVRTFADHKIRTGDVIKLSLGCSRKF